MLLLLGSFLVLMLVGAPVAVSMATASLLYLVFYGVAPDIIAAQRMIAGVESFPLLAVPFFILAGNLMNTAGVTGRIYSFALAVVGWMKGGLAQVNIIGSVVFAGMSGAALADAAGIGTIEIKAMRDHGYPTEAAVGVTTAASGFAALIAAATSLSPMTTEAEVQEYMTTSRVSSGRIKAAASVSDGCIARRFSGVTGLA